MSILSSLFGSTKKTNQSAPFTAPTRAEDSPFYGQLSQLSKQRINAGITGDEMPGVGFGSDFVGRQTNPVAKAWQTQLQQETLPSIRNAYSSKGKAYSSLAADAENKAFMNTQNAIDQLMAQFTMLNENQKKADISQGIQVGENLNNSFLNQQNLDAQMRNANAEANTNRTVADNKYRTAQDQAKAKMFLGGATGAITGGFGAGQFSPIGALQGVMGTGSSGVGANILGNTGLTREQLIAALLGGE